MTFSAKDGYISFSAMGRKSMKTFVTVGKALANNSSIYEQSKGVISEVS
jgi:hypothetical protein